MEHSVSTCSKNMAVVMHVKCTLIDYLSDMVQITTTCTMHRTTFDITGMFTFIKAESEVLVIIPMPAAKLTIPDALARFWVPK